VITQDVPAGTKVKVVNQIQLQKTTNRTTATTWAPSP
jgi:hypothetical protein